MLHFFRRIIPETHPLRLLYYRVVAMLAAFFYGFPAQRLKVIAVTGTKGKTTLVHMIAHILESAGHRVGWSSTLDFSVAGKRQKNYMKQTTPGRFFLQRLLRDMVRVGCEYAIIEVTSHAIVQSRLWGVNVDCAVLTNIQRDHLEYHGGMESYIQAKEKLFLKLNRSRRKPSVQKIAVLPEESEVFSLWSVHTYDRLVTFGRSKGFCRAENIGVTADNSTFSLVIPNQRVDIALPMAGEFNVINALAASAVCIAHHINLTTIQEALNRFPGVPGRIERISAGQPYTVVVDYSYSTEPLEEVCTLFRTLTKGKVILVFGATGGGRDKGKRVHMGEVADKYADYIIVTDDDPYEDDEVQIIEDICKGIRRKEGDRLWKIVDRYEAIRLALTLAKKGDTVLIAGKGGEEMMAIKGKLIPWDDRQVVRDLLSREVEVVLGEGRTKIVDNKCMAG